jgi:predicted AlkP superfamily phosphohydrolase/phosphomutase
VWTKLADCYATITLADIPPTVITNSLPTPFRKLHMYAIKAKEWSDISVEFAQRYPRLTFYVAGEHATRIAIALERRNKFGSTRKKAFDEAVEELRGLGKTAIQNWFDMITNAMRKAAAIDESMKIMFDMVAIVDEDAFAASFMIVTACVGNCSTFSGLLPDNDIHNWMQFDAILLQEVCTVNSTGLNMFFEIQTQLAEVLRVA